jgi:hypothetical protein
MASAAAADPAALLDMAAAAEQKQQQARRAPPTAAAAASAARYARAPAPIPRHQLPLDLLLAPLPAENDPEHLRRQASAASTARARRDLFVAPKKELALMLQAAALPLAIFAYGVAANDDFCKGHWDRYWTHVPRVRTPALRHGAFGVLQGGRGQLMMRLDGFLRATTRQYGRLLPHLRPRPKGAPGQPPPPMPPPKDF